MTKWNTDKPDYARSRYEWTAHHARFVRYVEAHGLPCQACAGRGHIGYDSMEYGPADPCGWCETTGLVTRWLRGLWLREMRHAKTAKTSRTEVMRVAS